MVDVDPYGRANPLGPGGMLRAYRTAATAVGTGRSYADLVREQAPLDVTGIDAGLAVTVAAHQSEIDAQATEYVDTVVADYITLASDVGNFVSLVKAFGSEAATMRQLSEQRTWGDVNTQLGAISDTAGEVGVDGDTALDHVGTVRSDVKRSGRKLDAVMKLAIAALGDDGKAAAARIDALTTKISGNIQDIVDGATETGDAFTSLGIGVLTMITQGTGDTSSIPKADDDDDDEPAPSKGGGAGTGDTSADDDETSNDTADDDASATSDDDTDTDDDDDDDDDDDGDGDDDDDDDDDTDEESASTKNKSDGKVPDVSFVVSAIKAGSKGTEKYAAALASLDTNNERLAVQYQRLAASDRLVAVAKATQAQKNLFSSSVNDTAAAMKAIRAEWLTLQRSFAAWSGKTGGDAAAALAKLVPGALTQWQAVDAELGKIKRSLTGTGRRPGR